MLFFITWFFSHTCICLLRTNSKRLTKEILLGKCHLPHLPSVVKVRGSTILLAGGLQSWPGVDITVREGVKYLEVLRSLVGQFSPILFQFRALQSEVAFKFAALLLINN